MEIRIKIGGAFNQIPFAGAPAEWGWPIEVELPEKKMSCQHFVPYQDLLRLLGAIGGVSTLNMLKTILDDV